MMQYRLPIYSLGLSLVSATACHAQAAMNSAAVDKAGTMAGHCQTPEKNANGVPIKTAEGHQITVDCPKQGTMGHPVLPPKDKRPANQ